MANVVPFQQTGLCPAGGRTSFPAGTLMTIGDWTDLGCPKGWEAVGCTEGGPVRGFNVILRKKARRRSRRPLPPTLVAQFAQLKDQLGPAMAKTIINRMRF